MAPLEKHQMRGTPQVEHKNHVNQLLLREKHEGLVKQCGRHEAQGEKEKRIDESRFQKLSVVRKKGASLTMENSRPRFPLFVSPFKNA